MPMTALPLAARSYALDARAAAGHRLVNMVAEPMPEGSRAPFMLKPTPGLSRYKAFAEGPVHAMATLPGYLYVASGNGFFRVRSDGSPDAHLGDIGAPSGATSIAVGDRQVVVCNPPRAYVASHDGLLRRIDTGANFPAGGASAVAYIDGYFVFTSYEGTFFFTSKLLDAENFDPLDFARSERRPDIVQYCVSHMGELWLFGLNSIAVWYNAGTADFPFRERVGGVQDRGVGQLRTIAALGNSLVFLADDRVVYRTQGYQLVRISDHALEEKLSRYGNLREISGCSFVWEGHEHYALKLPNAPPFGKTFVYDGSTQAWHERSSEAGGEGIWRVDRSARFGVVPVFGSATEGRLYLMDAELATDDGVPIRRRAVLPPLHHEGARAFLPRVELDMEVGTGDPPGSVHLTWSDDGGATWSAGRHLSYGAAGETRKRVVATRLGSFRQRLLAIEASHKLALWGVDADVQVGAH